MSYELQAIVKDTGIKYYLGNTEYEKLRYPKIILQIFKREDLIFRIDYDCSGNGNFLEQDFAYWQDIEFNLKRYSPLSKEEYNDLFKIDQVGVTPNMLNDSECIDINNMYESYRLDMSVTTYIQLIKLIDLYREGIISKTALFRYSGVKRECVLKFL